MIANNIENILANYTEVNGCWVWNGHKDEKKYPLVSFRGKPWRVHRLVAHCEGLNITGRLVCHRCDNPPCINPKHLFVGTSKDNVADCIRKMRHQHGEDHWKTKLLEDDVVYMRSSGKSVRVLMKEFDMSQTGIESILNRKTWSHV